MSGRPTDRAESMIDLDRELAVLVELRERSGERIGVLRCEGRRAEEQRARRPQASGGRSRTRWRGIESQRRPFRDDLDGIGVAEPIVAGRSGALGSAIHVPSTTNWYRCRPTDSGSVTVHRPFLSACAPLVTFVSSQSLKSPTRETFPALGREEDELDDGVRNREPWGNSRRLSDRRAAVPV